MLTAAQQMKEQADCRPRLVRAAMLAIDVVGEKHGLHLFRFVMVVEKLAQAAGEERDQLRNFVARDSPKPPACAEQIHPSTKAGGIDFRRRLEKKWLQIAGQPLQLIVDADEGLRIFG